VRFYVSRLGGFRCLEPVVRIQAIWAGRDLRTRHDPRRVCELQATRGPVDVLVIEHIEKPSPD
jgi:hypothetical protein